LSRSIALALPFLAIGLVAAASPMQNGRTVVTRNSLTEACSRHAQLAGEGKMAPIFAVNTCTEAIETEAWDKNESAKLHNNRGVVQLTLMGAVDDAKIDFDEAAKLDPKLGESYANRGAALVAEERFPEAIAEIDKGLALGLREPWKAYFNRALARERSSDVRGAYQDFQKALELKPGWAMATTELARFQVRGR
jgi:tetratricopeptide (TPR) repeat protein